MKNKYCSLSDLTNEASVEARFINPLLADLNFIDDQIKLKTSLKETKVGKGSKSSLYRPDYLVLIGGIPALIIDAKSPTEPIADYEYQCSSYCLEINKSFDYNPLDYFILSNGIKTRLQKWDLKIPLLEMDFEDFVPGNQKYADLHSRIGHATLFSHSSTLRATLEAKPFAFQKISLAELTLRFQRIHQYIWTREKKSPSAAFEELMKIVFVKIKKDAELHQRFGPNPHLRFKDVVFNTHWISEQTESESPINDPLFKNLVRELEDEIANDKKKRIFNTIEYINLSSDTIRWVVKELQNIDFVSMEDDIHGRMFEAFLNATIRGRELGQFFTPRDIVDLMVRLAPLRVSKTEISRVLDACCGSGGFLIAAMSRMQKLARDLVGLSSVERGGLLERIRNEALFGIDAGSDPAIYRIARMNMYLHGDGGSHIYHADSLDKSFGAVGKADREYNKQLQELREIVHERGTKFDVILSNPPFSMKYTRDDEEQAAVLNQYRIATDRDRGKILPGLLSSVMFLERYKDLVAPSGEILAIIDDSVLSGPSYFDVRKYIRSNFIIKGIISLPGDAFRRAAARVKTSVLILRLRAGHEDQGEAFMDSAVALGLEEKVARRIGLTVTDLEQQKKGEIEWIAERYRQFCRGVPGDYVVPPERLVDRLDVKFCIADRGRRIPLWAKRGLKVIHVAEALTPAVERNRRVNADDEYQFLKVNYGGEVQEGELIIGEECSYSVLYEVREWDILLSNMGVGRGAVGIVPPFHAGKFVSNEYTILRAASEEEAVYYASLLRTKEILGDILATTTGMNRGRIRWENIGAVQVPEYTPGNKDIEQVVADLKALWAAHERFSRGADSNTARVIAELDVDGQEARRRWLAFKPPE